MGRYYYDLHVHSCLSPCGDDDMTPANIAGMAVVNGLQIVALTDHNSTANCPAFYAQAKKNGLIPVAGMELTTSEDVHVVCLFPTLEEAMAFGETVEKRRIRIRNKADIFGRQQVMDENDQVVREEEDLLINATTVSIEEAFGLVQSFGGICYPAHIDRSSNGMVAVLGSFPQSPAFTAYELNDPTSYRIYTSMFPHIRPLAHVLSSDAHYLWDMSEADHWLELEDEPYSSDRVRQSLFRYLRGEISGTDQPSAGESET